MKAVYLLHRVSQGSLPPTHHAVHYLGSAEDLAARLHEHRAGNGSRLTAAWVAAGAGFVVARVWPADSPRTLEAKLKGRTAWHSARSTANGTKTGSKANQRLCPICHGGAMVDLAPGGVEVLRVNFYKSENKRVTARRRWEAKGFDYFEEVVLGGKVALVIGKVTR